MMKCTEHPAADATAYCQHCGKPLCALCVRTWGERALCEPCHASAAAATAAESASRSMPHPALAAVLGFIPGVGAMYNGQLAKALAHVVIFAIFVVLSHVSVIFALLIPAWVLYQVFEAYQTAKARVEGKPVPDHLGLNEISTRWLGGLPAEPIETRSAPPGRVIDTAEPNAASPSRSREPAWAIVLIVAGLLLLSRTLGIFEAQWLSRTWPILLVLFGIWLLTRNLLEVSRTKAMSGGKKITHAVRGPSFLILLGALWSLDRWNVLSFRQSWPLFLILGGLLILFERAAASAGDRPDDGAPHNQDEAA